MKKAFLFKILSVAAITAGLFAADAKADDTVIIKRKTKTVDIDVHSSSHRHHHGRPVYVERHRPVVVARPVYVERRVVVERPVYGASVGLDVQRALARKGYYGGVIDGDVGPRTRASIRAYQVDRGLPVTGQIDGSLLRSLRLL